MEEKNLAKFRLSKVLLVIAIIAIIVMGFFIYKLSKDKTTEVQKSTELQTQVNTLNEAVNNLQENVNETDAENDEKVETQNSYITNFSQSVSNELGQNNAIRINLNAIDFNNSTGYVSINNKHEAYIYLSNFDGFSSANNPTKIADNVVNAWYCIQGQAPGNNYIIFLKEDGSVTYVRFRSTGDGKTTFESEEKTLNGITNISNIVPIEGSDANGIGGYGVLFIKNDGTCIPFSTLDDLAK